jgi:lysophospholipase L1-like esterase
MILRYEEDDDAAAAPEPEPEPPAGPEPEPEPQQQRPQPHLLAYGDSLTAGYHDSGYAFAPYSVSLAATLGCTVDTCGASGVQVYALANAQLDSSSCVDVVSQEYSGLGHLLKQRAADADGLPWYAAVLIMGGTNDLAAQWTAEEIMQSLRTLHERCWSHGLRTVALSVPPNMATAGGHAEYIQSHRELNRLIEEMADSDKRCVFADSGLLVPWGAEGCWEPDGLHFSPAGSARLGRGLGELAAVREFLLLGA